MWRLCEAYVDAATRWNLTQSDDDKDDMSHAFSELGARLDAIARRRAWDGKGKAK